MLLFIENNSTKTKEMSFDEILCGFKKSRYNDIDSRPFYFMLNLYITNNDGLNSTFEQEEFDKLLAYGLDNRNLWLKENT